MFQPYANVTVFKVMSYLTDNDWLKRKLALNVLYTIAFYCKDELVALKEHVFDFLKLLKTDKVKEVREVALSILKILNDGEEKKLNKSTEEIRTKKRQISTILSIQIMLITFQQIMLAQIIKEEESILRMKEKGQSHQTD